MRRRRMKTYKMRKCYHLQASSDCSVNIYIQICPTFLLLRAPFYQRRARRRWLLAYLTLLPHVLALFRMSQTLATRVDLVRDVTDSCHTCWPCSECHRLLPLVLALFRMSQTLATRADLVRDVTDSCHTCWPCSGCHRLLPHALALFRMSQTLATRVGLVRDVTDSRRSLTFNKQDQNSTPPQKKRRKKKRKKKLYIDFLFYVQVRAVCLLRILFNHGLVTC